jgi:hypothetical protein
MTISHIRLLGNHFLSLRFNKDPEKATPKPLFGSGVTFVKVALRDPGDAQNTR